jgi:SPP1 gp7 family putative phage head morphogenesis protein
MKDIYSPDYAKYLTTIRERFEALQIKRFIGIWEARLSYLADTVLKYGLGYNIQKLGFELVFQDSLVSFMREWVNIGQNHGMNEIDTSLKMAEFKTGTKNANSYFDTYALKLAKVTDKDLLKKTQAILKEGLKSGETTRSTIKKLEKLYPSFAKQRLENIVRTESGKCYNWGRLTSYYQNADVIEGVRFSAIMDGRTTDICIARHGLTLPLSDQAGIASNTPPLHYQCRSVWVPIAIGQSKWHKMNKEQYQPIIEKMPPMAGFGYQDLSGITKMIKTIIPIIAPKPITPKPEPKPIKKVFEEEAV